MTHTEDCTGHHTSCVVYGELVICINDFGAPEACSACEGRS